nr:type I restriction enzyme HsdR N-terminal domain-containing protein [uncultured Methanobrevibacter sp.]
MPLFRILGYDTENPDEVKAEYVCDVGVKTSEKVDLAILIDDEVKMLVECKSAKTKLNSNHLNQLFRYYSVSDARIAILTNGVEYRFFTDSVKSGRMDSEPFLIVDVVNDDLSVLELFSREKYNDEKIEALVDELKYRTAIREILLSEFSNPSDEFVGLIAKQVYSGRLTSDKRKMFKKLISKELEVILSNVVFDYVKRIIL